MLGEGEDFSILGLSSSAFFLLVCRVWGLREEERGKGFGSGRSGFWVGL